MYEVIVVWSCELLQQLSNVMIAGESSAQPPAADWMAHSRQGTISEGISPQLGTEFSFSQEIVNKDENKSQKRSIIALMKFLLPFLKKYIKSK